MTFKVQIRDEDDELLYEVTSQADFALISDQLDELP